MVGRKLIAIIFLGWILRAGYTAATYEPSLRSFFADDWVLYRMTAETIARGDWSFTLDTFVLRPPLFPMIAALLDLRPQWILAANLVFSTLVIVCAYAMARGGGGAFPESRSSGRGYRRN